MSGPNVGTWYAVLFGWGLCGVAGKWSVLILLVIGIASVIADAYRDKP